MRKRIKEEIRNMTIYEIVKKYPKTKKIFEKHGLTCFNCPIAMQETLEEGWLAHQIDIDKILKEFKLIMKKTLKKEEK